MLTMWLFYEAIRVRPLRRGYLTAASVAFCLTYLSWEGTGFLLPAFFIALIVVHPGEWWWLKEFHLYRCLFFMAVLVVAQYLLADDRRHAVSYARLGAFECCRPIALFSDARL